MKFIFFFALLAFSALANAQRNTCGTIIGKCDYDVMTVGDDCVGFDESPGQCSYGHMNHEFYCRSFDACYEDLTMNDMHEMLSSSWSVCWSDSEYEEDFVSEKYLLISGDIVTDVMAHACEKESDKRNCGRKQQCYFKGGRCLFKDTNADGFMKNIFKDLHIDHEQSCEEIEDAYNAEFGISEEEYEYEYEYEYDNWGDEYEYEYEYEYDNWGDEYEYEYDNWGDEYEYEYDYWGDEYEYEYEYEYFGNYEYEYEYEYDNTPCHQLTKPAPHTYCGKGTEHTYDMDHQAWGCYAICAEGFARNVETGICEVDLSAWDTTIGTPYTRWVNGKCELNLEAIVEDTMANAKPFKLSGKNCEMYPVTDSPTAAPTFAPTNAPTQNPTQSPTANPTSSPTSSPTNAPTYAPTNAPTNAPTYAPTNAPTYAPTNAPTSAPTQTPTQDPTAAPTATPTNAPTAHPTAPTFVQCPTAKQKLCLQQQALGLCKWKVVKVKKKKIGYCMYATKAPTQKPTAKAAPIDCSAFNGKKKACLKKKGICKYNKKKGLCY